MRYTLVSTPIAEDELAFIWAIASDRDAVARASNEIDIILRHSPMTYGVDHGSFWALEEAPLTVVYRVSPDDRQVIILQYLYHG